MPVYEYDCYDCQILVTVLFLSFSEVETEGAVCPHCGGTNLERRIPSRVSMLSGSPSAENQTTPSSAIQSVVDKEDPQELAFEMRQASSRSRQDLGQEFNEVASRLEKGESASSIDRSLRKRIGRDRKVH